MTTPSVPDAMLNAGRMAFTNCPIEADFEARLAAAYLAMKSSAPQHTGLTDVERVAEAIEKARCIGREGPFGGYDYGYNPGFYGPPPEGGRYVIRDFRDPSSPDWGKWVHQTDDRAEHEAQFEKMTREHYARAAIAAMPQQETSDEKCRSIHSGDDDQLADSALADCGLASQQPIYADVERLSYLVACARQGEGPSVRCEGPGDYEIGLAREWVERVLRALRENSAALLVSDRSGEERLREALSEALAYLDKYNLMPKSRRDAIRTALNSPTIPEKSDD